MGDEGACAVQRGPVSGSFLVPTDSTRTQRRAEALGGLPASHTGTQEQAAGSWLWGICAHWDWGVGEAWSRGERGAGASIRPELLRRRQGPPTPQRSSREAHQMEERSRESDPHPAPPRPQGTGCRRAEGTAEEAAGQGRALGSPPGSAQLSGAGRGPGNRSHRGVLGWPGGGGRSSGLFCPGGWGCCGPDGRILLALEMKQQSGLPPTPQCRGNPRPTQGSCEISGPLFSLALPAKGSGAMSFHAGPSRTSAPATQDAWLGGILPQPLIPDPHAWAPTCMSVCMHECG